MEKGRPKTPVQSIEAKELQKYFNNTRSVLLIPKGSDGKLHSSSLGLLFDKQTYDEFEKYDLQKNLKQLFKDKYPILIISIRDGTSFAGLAIRDMSSPLKLTFPDQPVGATLAEFMESTPEGAEIDMTMGFVENNGNMVIEPGKDTYHLLMLKGYYFDHIM